MYTRGAKLQANTGTSTNTRDQVADIQMLKSTGPEFGPNVHEEDYVATWQLGAVSGQTGE